MMIFRLRYLDSTHHPPTTTTFGEEMRILNIGKSRYLLWIVAISLLLGGVSNAAGVFNTQSTGYTVCIDSKTKVVTFPGTENCKSGQRKLVLGAQGLKGDVGPIGTAGKDGAVGATGPVGPAGLDGKDGAVGATGPTGPVGPAGLNGKDGAPGATGPAGIAGLNGKDGEPGPSEIWLTPADLVPLGLTEVASEVSLERISVGQWNQYVIQITDSSMLLNLAQATIALPRKWRESNNVYATVYWSAEKTDGNIAMSIGYTGVNLGDVPSGPGFMSASECANTNPSKADVIQSCSYRLSEVIYKDDQISTIAVNRWGAPSTVHKGVDSNTGSLYIYGIKLELRD